MIPNRHGRHTAEDEGFDAYHFDDEDVDGCDFPCQSSSSMCGWLGMQL